jgi:hypothetical protein
MDYGIFWRNSIGSKKVFLQQKRIIRIMTGSNSRTSCKPLFQRLKILTLSSQYVLYLMGFLSQNLEIYTFNSTIHGFNTRHRLQLHKPSTNVTVYQKEAYCESIKIFYKLPEYVVEVVLRKKCFVPNMKKYPTDKAFYSIEEYMNT